MQMQSLHVVALENFITRMQTHVDQHLPPCGAHLHPLRGVCEASRKVSMSDVVMIVSTNCMSDWRVRVCLTPARIYRMSIVQSAPRCSLCGLKSNAASCAVLTMTIAKPTLAIHKPPS